MSYEEIREITGGITGNIICDKLCVLPSKIASLIASVAYGAGDYGVVLIGVDKCGDEYNILGIDRAIIRRMDNIIENSLKQVSINTHIEYKHCSINYKNIYVIKVKTCPRISQQSEGNKRKMYTLLKDLLTACIKLQANSHYNQATEDQRNDFIRDLLETAKYVVKDQTRRGLSPTGIAAGEADLLIMENELPMTIIEALNLDSLNKSYLNAHIDKVYDYDTAGNSFNVVLSYVSVNDFLAFTNKYIKHIKEYTYPYPVINIEDDLRMEGFNYSDIKVMKTVLNRNNVETILFHVCIHINN